MRAALAILLLVTIQAPDSLAQVQEAYIKPSNTETQDQFGDKVAIDGDTLVVISPFEDSSATGVNGDQSDNSLIDPGAAYVFVKSGGVWSQQAYLKASNTGAFDDFGISVAISGDTIVVGAIGEDSDATSVNGDQSNDNAPQSGAAYVFVRNAGVWTQQAYLKASNAEADDRFGESVDVDGDTIVVGATWEDSAATGINGDQSDNSADRAGAAYVFVRSAGVWSQQAYLKASNTEADDRFASVTISGDTIAVGAARESSSSPGVNGDQSDNGLNSSGAAYVFVRSGSTWTQEAYLKAATPGFGDFFGFPVCSSGQTIVVGAYREDSGATGVNGDETDDSVPGSGAAYVFVKNAGVWSQEAYVKSSNPDINDDFATTLQISGNKLIVGARGEDSSRSGVNSDQSDNDLSAAGAAYLFERSGAIWSQTAYLKASTLGQHDNFGASVGISGDLAVAGAFLEDSDSTGINGDQGDVDLFFGAGAAYAFDLAATPLAGTAYCFGDGSGNVCPCTLGATGAGCANSSGSGARLSAGGTPSATGTDSFVLLVADSAPGTPGLIVQGINQLAGGNGNLVGNGLLCVSPQKRWFVQSSDSLGNVVYGPGLFSTDPAAAPGATLLYQWWYRDNSDPCGNGFNFSNGWSTTWQ